MAERQQGLQAFLDVLVKQIDLSSSIIIQRFLDPERHLINYSGSNEFLSKKTSKNDEILLELALQHVSMFIRSTNNTYQNVEEFTDLGSLENRKKLGEIYRRFFRLEKQQNVFFSIENRNE